jgi:MoaA/NifB/PqqE/SkfB family radical SAM enzyme
MSNPFQHWYDSCNSGDSAAKLAALPPFPTHIDVELTSVCNFRCLMCPTGNLSLQRDGEFMEWDTFDQIIDQCEPHGAGIRFIGWGEPMMHPQLFRFIRRASDALLPTHLNTNGSKLHQYEQNMILNMGLDSIKVSMQGTTAESYRDMRNIDYYEGVFTAVRTLHRRRGNAPRPWIHVSTTITDEHPSTVEVFKKRFAPYCDQISVGYTTFDYLDLAAVRLGDQDRERLEKMVANQEVEKRHPSCPEVYDKLTIHADGSARVCCNDYNGETFLGNVNDTPIGAMFHHPVIKEYREKLAREEHDYLHLCADCYDYMELTND